MATAKSCRLPILATVIVGEDDRVLHGGSLVAPGGDVFGSGGADSGYVLGVEENRKLRAVFHGRHIHALNGYVVGAEVSDVDEPLDTVVVRSWNLYGQAYYVVGAEEFDHLSSSGNGNRRGMEKADDFLRRVALKLPTEECEAEQERFHFLSRSRYFVRAA